MPFFTHAEIRFCYQISGQGPPIIFCHGLGADGQQPTTLFDAIPDRRTIVWDCRGHGQTEPLGPENGLSFSTFAEDLSALMQHLSIARAIVVGISMGAATAVRFATRWPDRVEGLVLIRPAWLNEASPPNLAIFGRIADLMACKDQDDAVSELENDPYFSAVEAVSQDVAKSLRQQITMPGSARRRVCLRRMPASAPIDSWNELAVVSCPALVVGTEFDPVHPLDFARIWSDKLPRADLVVVTSKAVCVRQHREQLNSCLRRWLERSNRASLGAL
jgi:pimeloyl-ACP methyl ester carboxylesterase